MPQNQARETSKILRLAVMDFALAPLETIREELGLKTRQVYDHRNTDLYRESVKELQEAFKEKMLATPGTNELRKQINYGLGMAVKWMLSALSSVKTGTRDKIGLCRLMAQMDGRFIGSESADGDHSGKDTESVAQELLTALNRHKETLQ